MPKTATAIKQVLIVDDHPIVREGLRRRIEAQPDKAVCGEAGRMSEALACIQKCAVDVAIVDISLEGRSGLDLIKQMRASGHSFPVLVLSIHDEATYARRALAAGAQGYLSKSEAPGQIVHAVNRILDGHFYVSDRIANKLFGLLGQRSAPGDELAGLSDRELEVLDAVGRGLTTRRISADLALSVSTIETYKTRLKTKLGLSNASELAAWASAWRNRKFAIKAD
jgi:DNA-binding NarL/FixJ family response regulator